MIEWTVFALDVDGQESSRGFTLLKNGSQRRRAWLKRVEMRAIKGKTPGQPQSAPGSQEVGLEQNSSANLDDALATAAAGDLAVGGAIHRRRGCAQVD